MWNNMIDNKTYNLNFSVAFDLSDKSRGRSSLSNNSAKLPSRLFFQKINRGGEIQARKVSSISFARIHVSHYRFVLSWKNFASQSRIKMLLNKVLKNGSTPYKK